MPTQFAATHNTLWIVRRFDHTKNTHLYKAGAYYTSEIAYAKLYKDVKLARRAVKRDEARSLANHKARPQFYPLVFKSDVVEVTLTQNMVVPTP